MQSPEFKLHPTKKKFIKEKKERNGSAHLSLLTTMFLWPPFPKSSVHSGHTTP
jgi:hypothetical protein